MRRSDGGHIALGAIQLYGETSGERRKPNLRTLSLTVVR